MKKFTEIIYGIIGLIVTIGFGYFIYKVIAILINNLDKVNANSFIGILGATVTLTGFFITRYIEKKRMIEIEIRNKKIPIYEEFMGFYFSVIFQKKTDKAKRNNEIVDFFRNFHQKAIIWFPDEVLKAYIDWKDNLTSFSQEKIELHDIIFQQEEFIKLIRKDIGHLNNNIEKWKISSLYINDLDNIVPEKSKL